jgi:hypothetical protein
MTAAPEELAFPEGFTWGAATAAFQIEGAHDADGKGPSIWDDFSHAKGKTYRGHHGDVACDHYHKVEADVAMMKEMGLPAYPVFTHKHHTDVSYLACARALIGHADVIYPQFASHNAATLAAIGQLARAAGARFEFQRLHGMGEGVYRELLAAHGPEHPLVGHAGLHRVDEIAERGVAERRQRGGQRRGELPRHARHARGLRKRACDGVGLPSHTIHAWG